MAGSVHVCIYMYVCIGGGGGVFVTISSKLQWNQFDQLMHYCVVTYHHKAAPGKPPKGSNANVRGMNLCSSGTFSLRLSLSLSLSLSLFPLTPSLSHILFAS